MQETYYYTCIQLPGLSYSRAITKTYYHTTNTQSQRTTTQLRYVYTIRMRRRRRRGDLSITDSFLYFERGKQLVGDGLRMVSTDTPHIAIQMIQEHLGIITKWQRNLSNSNDGDRMPYFLFPQTAFHRHIDLNLISGAFDRVVDHIHFIFEQAKPKRHADNDDDDTAHNRLEFYATALQAIFMKAAFRVGENATNAQIAVQRILADLELYNSIVQFALKTHLEKHHVGEAEPRGHVEFLKLFYTYKPDDGPLLEGPYPVPVDPIPFVVYIQWRLETLFTTSSDTNGAWWIKIADSIATRYNQETSPLFRHLTISQVFPILGTRLQSTRQLMEYAVREFAELSDEHPLKRLEHRSVRAFRYIMYSFAALTQIEP